MRLIVAGSRHWENVQVIYRSLDILLSNTDKTQVTIISGHCSNSKAAEAKGIIDSPDMAGEYYAQMRGLDLEIYPANWHPYDPYTGKTRYDNSAGYKRNAKMANLATHLAAFWDHQSRGTEHMINLAREKGLSVAIIDKDGIITRC